MAKYDEFFKLMVIREYLDGSIGYKNLARKHGVKSHTPIVNWVASYKKYGEEGLKRKRNSEVYPVPFKLDVLSFMKRAGASVNETALQFGLNNPSMISAWKKKLLEGGAEALDQSRGRHPCLIKIEIERRSRIGNRRLNGKMNFFVWRLNT